LERAPERVLEMWLASPRDDARVRELKTRAEVVGLHIHAASQEALAKLVGDVVHQGVVAAMRPLKSWDEHDLIDALAHSPKDPVLLVLDGVTDPHNLGACLRSADAAGALAVIIPKDRAAAVDGVVRKVAAGAAEFVPVASVTNLARTLESLKEHGIWVVGTDGEALKVAVCGV
jgi:23S rRNA (guanosine2251-2'-O)-methyltransferase